MLLVASDDVSSTRDNGTFYYLIVVRIRCDTLKLVGNFNCLEKTEEISNYF